MGRRKNRTRSSTIELGARIVLDDDDSTGEKEETNILRNLAEIPEIFFEVFTRLAPQTLFKFKCVSKGLGKFIGEARFAAHQYRNCKVIAGRSLTGLFFQNNEEQARFWYRGIEVTRFIPVGLEAGGLPDPCLEFLKQKGKSDEVEVIDSCNGLLFCSNTAWNNYAVTYFVCNPLTKQKIALPHPRKPSDRVSYALVADLEHHYLKYRILCLVRPPRYSYERYSELSILSSETGEWKELEEKVPPVSCEFFKGSKVFFNGSLYWDCLEDHILVCDLNVNVIEAPRAPLGRCLWKSEDKLHCFCHGFGDEFPEWTLSVTDEQEFKWQLLHEDSQQFRNLTHDFTEYCTYRWITERKIKPRIQLKIISYAPESKTFFVFIPEDVYAYHVTERRVEYLGGAHSYGSRTFHSDCLVLPYVHSLVHIQTAKAADDEADCGMRMPKNKTVRADCESETGSGTKNVAGRRNTRGCLDAKITA